MSRSVLHRCQGLSRLCHEIADKMRWTVRCLWGPFIVRRRWVGLRMPTLNSTPLPRRPGFETLVRLRSLITAPNSHDAVGTCYCGVVARPPSAHDCAQSRSPSIMSWPLFDGETSGRPRRGAGYRAVRPLPDGSLVGVEGAVVRALCGQISSPEAAECVEALESVEVVLAAAGGSAASLARTLEVKFGIAAASGIEVAGGRQLLEALTAAGSARVVGLAVEKWPTSYTVYADESLSTTYGVIRVL